MNLWNELYALLTSERAVGIFYAALILLLGLILSALLRRWLRKTPRLSAQQALILNRLGSAIILALAVTVALNQLGFHIGALLGAAGVLTVAIGFASQTSVSNLISGLFLIGEQPFVVGDVIEADGATGEVVSIDLLSIKLRTFDNILVRIPNEAMIKTKIRTLTAFPIRRLDLKIGVAYGSDLAHVREVLLKVAARSPICLEEPKPIIIFLGFGDSSMDLQFSIWAAKERFLELRNTVSESVKVAFDEAGIEIPFPQRTLSVIGGEPLPVRVVNGGKAA